MGRKVVAVVVRCVFVLKGKFVASHFIIKSRAVGLPGRVLFLSSIHRASCGCETHFYHRPWWLRVRPGIAIVVYIILVLPPSVPPSLRPYHRLHTPSPPRGPADSARGSAAPVLSAPAPSKSERGSAALAFAFGREGAGAHPHGAEAYVKIKSKT
jgi:hypothetical protein